jgi:hypothetical protein
MLFPGRYTEAQTGNDLFFELNLLSAPGENSSLLDRLRSPTSTLRDKTEKIDGHDCQVLDVAVPKWGYLQETIWLDASRGYLPIRRLYYTGGKAQKTAMEYTIEKAIEVREGLWVGVRGHKRVFPVFGNDPQIGKGFLSVMNVDPASGGYAIAVNRGVKDDFFDLAAHLPPGTMVLDTATKASWITGINAAPVAAPVASNQAVNAKALLSPIAPETALKFDWLLDDWGETVKGLKCRVRQRADLSEMDFFLDLQNVGDESFTVSVNDAILELDGKRYHQEGIDGTTSMYLGAKRELDAIGQLSAYAVNWKRDDNGQLLWDVVTEGEHRIRLGLRVHPSDPKAAPIEVMTPERSLGKWPPREAGKARAAAMKPATQSR